MTWLLKDRKHPWVPSVNTDIRATFAKERERQARERAGIVEPKVTPIKGRK